jgi:hypothetical protein
MVTLRSEESEMDSGEKCLRTLVDKWFGPSAVMTIRVMEFSRTPTDRTRFVRVGAAHTDGSLTIVFFRHADGSWNVYPAKASRPTMRAYPFAA